MEKCSTVIIGGGASGICAAISLSRRGEQVVVCEKMPQLGKKILASGNGRCNLLNDGLSADHYNPAARALVKSIFDRFGKEKIISLFESLGLRFYSQDGRIFPVTNQAASVLKVLEMELRRLSVPIEFNFSCSSILITRNGFIVSSNAGTNIECQKVIIAGGGKTYPAYGSDGSMYEIARQLGHSIIDPVPAAVPLVVKDSLSQVLQGQKISANVRSIIQGREGKVVQGELLFSKYGLSGTAILDVSEEISVAINRHHITDVSLLVDMVPFMDWPELKAEMEKRKREHWPPAEMLVGILPNKLAIALKDLFEKNDINAIISSLKGRRFKVSGTRGWNEAEFTSGGINNDEISPGTLESKIKKGIYFAGEILDVNGQRGGYNLGWAWASGWVSGLTG